MGYKTFPESARVIIDTKLSEGSTLEEIRRDELAFQQEVLEMKKDIESRAPRDKTIFFQRGVPDSLAYYRFIGADTRSILDICRGSSYKAVFILEPIAYQQDHARTEGEEGGKRIFELLKQAYTELGMRVVVIPRASIEERAGIILSEVGKG